MSIENYVSSTAFIKDAAQTAQRNLPQGRIGGLVAQLRRRARLAEIRSYFVLTALMVVIIAGLAFYLALPYWSQYVDSREQTLTDTIVAIDAETEKLDIERAELKKRLANALISATEIIPSGTENALSGHLLLKNGTILLYGENGAIIRSSDLGKSFSNIPSKVKGYPKGHLLLDDGTILLYYEHGEIIRSSDQGESFKRVHSGFKYGLRGHLLLKNETIIIFGSDGAVIRSIDRGNYFTRIPSGLRYDLRDHLLLDDGTIILLGEHGAITHSIDQGKSFIKTSSEITYDLRRHLLLDDGTIILYGYNSEIYNINGDIIRSNDNGKSFTMIPVGVESSLYQHLRLIDGTILIYGKNSEIIRSIDQGVSFTRVPLQIKGDLREHLLLDDGTILIYGSNGTVIRSNNQGESFTKVPSKVKSYLKKHLLLNDGTILVYGGIRDIIRSTDQGNSFVKIPSGLASSLRGHLLLDDGTILLYGSNGAISRSNDQGKSFTVISSGIESYPEKHLRLEDGTILLYGRGENIIVVSNRISSTVSALKFPTDMTGEHNDTKLSEILGNLQAHHKTIPSVQDVKSKLSLIITKRSVLDIRKEATLVNLATLKDKPWSIFIVEKQRERFADFMATCRGDGVASSEVGSPEPVTLACTQAWAVQRAGENNNWWQTLTAQVPPGVLLLFLLATLGGLYRYNLRLAGFHHSRADALELLSEKLSQSDLTALTDLSTSMAADKVEFGRANTPADQVTEIAKTLVGRFGKSV